VFGLQAVKTMRAQAGNEMGIHSDAISRQGVVSDRWRSNGFEPMRKPRGNGPFLTRATNCPAVTNLFQVAYRANDSGLGLSLDMAPVGLTVVAYADHNLPLYEAALRQLEKP